MRYHDHEQQVSIFQAFRQTSHDPRCGDLQSSTLSVSNNDRGVRADLEIGSAIAESGAYSNATVAIKSRPRKQIDLVMAIRPLPATVGADMDIFTLTIQVDPKHLPETIRIHETRKASSTGPAVPPQHQVLRCPSLLASIPWNR